MRSAIMAWPIHASTQSGAVDWAFLNASWASYTNTNMLTHTWQFLCYINKLCVLSMCVYLHVLMCKVKCSKVGPSRWILCVFPYERISVIVDVFVLLTTTIHIYIHFFLLGLIWWMHAVLVLGCWSLYIWQYSKKKMLLHACVFRWGGWERMVLYNWPGMAATTPNVFHRWWFSASRDMAFLIA